MLLLRASLAPVIDKFLPYCYHCYSEFEPLALIGISYSVCAADLWGSIPYVVDAKKVGIGFGFSTAIQNAGMAVGPSIFGAIIDNTQQY